MNFNEFLNWERTSRDIIDFKKTYIDMVNDINAGLMLSEIVYWYLPDAKGNSKLRVEKEGEYWIACRRYEWWERTRLSLKQADRAIFILCQAGLLVKDTFKFKGEPTMHVRLVRENFMQKWFEILNNPPQNPFLPKREKQNSPTGNNDFPQEDETISPDEETPVTETTTEDTTENSTFKEKVDVDAEHRHRDHATHDNQDDDTVEAEDEIIGIDPNVEEQVLAAIAKLWEVDADTAFALNVKTAMLAQFPITTVKRSFNFNPPVTVDEIEEFGDYYKHRYPGGKLPTSLEKIQSWFSTMRHRVSDLYVQRKGHQIKVKVKVEASYSTSQIQIMRYLQNFYAEEHYRIKEIFRVIDQEVGSRIKMSDDLTWDFRGQIIHIRVAIPDKYLNKTDGSWLDTYIKEYHPDEHKRICDEIARINEELDESISDAIG